MSFPRCDVADDESDILSSIPDGLLSEPHLSTISDSAQSLFNVPGSSFTSSTIKPRSTTSGVWKYGHKKIVNDVVKRHGKNAIWEARLLQLDLNDDELDTFINQAPTRLPKGMTALGWWLHPDRRQEWPRLS